MTAEKDLEARVEALETIVANLRAALLGATISAPSAQSETIVVRQSTKAEPEVADDDLLAHEWADMEIRRDPPRTQQPSHVGKRMSECTEAYLLDYAGFHEWKARKGREENPPRLNSKGKPWYEADELTAKVARGWAARAKKRGYTGVSAAKAKAKAPTMPSFESPAPPPVMSNSYMAEEDIPF